MARFGSLDTQYFDDAGNPLVSGKIYFYETGTTTPKNTYADINYTIANSNPVILTAAGRQPNIFFDGVAKAILTKSDDTQILVRDPVGDTASTFGNAWIASKDYNANDVVQGSDGEFYVSLVNGNVNNNPVTTSGYWTFLYSVEWNSGTTYKLGSVVTYQTIVYQSLQNANLNKNPSTETSWWVPIQLVWSSTATYAINANVVGTDGILYTSLQNANTNHIPASSPSWWVGTSAAAASSASAAATSASNAATSATNAANSATTATTQASNAASSASAASTSASNAATSATNAANSASSASSSASSASSSASSATSSASAASTSASNAATSETNAAASASSASSSASTATTQASNAASSASSASTSASNASTSATNAANSASSASTSATNAASSASSASTSATNAANSASAAAASFDSFDDRYLGAKASDPAVDNDGNPLLTGALYWNTTSSDLRVYNGSAWIVSYLPAAGSSGNVLTSNGSSWSSQPAPSGGLEYVVKTANYTVVDKQGVLADTSGGAFTVTLPVTPAAGAQVVVADAGSSWATNNLTIGRNGSTIGGLAQDLVCDITGASVQLVYDGSTWEVYAQIGGNGGTAVTLNGVQTLTNKTINGASNTLSVRLANDVTGTLPVANGGTGATSLTANNVILGNGTSAVQVVAPGSSGNVLTSNGTTWQSTAPAAAGFTLGTPITTTSGTTAEFTGLPAGIKQIVINFKEVSFNAYQGMYAQLGTSGSYVTSGYVGGNLLVGVAGGVGGFENASYVYLAGTDSTTQTEKYSGSVTFSLLNSSTNIWCWQGVVFDSLSYWASTAGTVTLTNAITRLKIAGVSAGTFDAGSINIMYI